MTELQPGAVVNRIGPDRGVKRGICDHGNPASGMSIADPKR
jgi:hypothetical protein